MCRLIVWAKEDNDDARDAERDARKFKRGMVVDILDDDHDPGAEVWKRGWWAVLDVPGAPKSQFADLIGNDPEYYEKLTFASRETFPRKRVQRIDLDALGKIDTSRPKVVEADALTAAKRTIQAKENPRVIGPGREVIG